MNGNRPFSHVPRRVLNAAVIAGGILGIILQGATGWDVLTTFVITLALCGLLVGAAALIYRTRG